MSILNHFGKVKTTFTPYTSKHHYNGDKVTMDFFTKFDTKYTNHAILNPHFLRVKGETTNKDGAGFCIKSYLTTGDFPLILKRIVEKISGSPYLFFDLNPLVSENDLICLKIDDVDSRVEHLEKIVKQVIDDNKLLQRKIDALEQQKHIKDLRVARSIRVLIQELD